MHTWVEDVTKTLLPLSNPCNAKAMKNYMRGQFDFIGVQAGPRRQALSALFSAENLPDIVDVPLVVDSLWDLDAREFQLVAVDLLIRLKGRLPISFAQSVEAWITTKSWWDTVDMLATHIAGSLFLNYPAEFDSYIVKWHQSDNLWLNRTSLLYQLKYKQQTDKGRLFAFICSLSGNQDFFIQKAIGWSLREYAKTNAQDVLQFVSEQDIQGLAKREALKRLRNHSY